MKAQFNCFCQQVDGWMLLKITEKIPETNLKFNPELRANQPSNNWAQVFKSRVVQYNAKQLFERGSSLREAPAGESGEKN